MKRQDQQSKAIKVFVGLSGGVDSAVSAALLKKAGYDVTGVFIKVWQPDWIECNWKDDRREAMRVAAHLEIPFVTLDLEKEYKDGVIDYMIAEYTVGRTPNPDVMCNREVKFGAFWKWAKEQGADYIATGHYARNTSSREEKTNNPDFAKATSGKQKQITKHELLMGKDSNKDQSYFLWTLTQKDLEHVLFPVGDLPKPEVRKLAKKFRLPNAERKDSQGLCFIGKVDVKDFLGHYIKTETGDVLNEQGKKIGAHSGAILFTIGERHGFTVTEKTPHDEPYYVVGKDTVKNILVVSNKKGAGDSLESSIQKIELTRCNWINGTPSAGTQLKARGRYRQQLFDIQIVEIENDKATISTADPLALPTSGQSLVIYEKERCVGGGVIE